MDKSILERLHIGDGEISKEKYIELMIKLENLKVPLLKRFYSVYKNIQKNCEKVINENFNENLDLSEERDEITKEIWNVDILNTFLKDRVKEDYNNFLDDSWKKSLENLDKELKNMDIKYITCLAILSHSLSSYIEMLLIKKDEYWMPYDMFSIYLYIEQGNSLVKERERIWQPK